MLDPQPNDPAQVPTATDENFSEVPVQSVAQAPTPSHYFEAKNDGKWLELIPHPSVVEILGRRGSGKSALGHRLLELFRFRSLPYVLGMSQHIIKDLPEWLGVINSPDECM